MNAQKGHQVKVIQDNFSKHTQLLSLKQSQNVGVRVLRVVQSASMIESGQLGAAALKTATASLPAWLAQECDGRQSNKQHQRGELAVTVLARHAHHQGYALATCKLSPVFPIFLSFFLCFFFFPCHSFVLAFAVLLDVFHSFYLRG